MSDIFISYVVEEDATLARDISQKLEDAGYNTWHLDRDQHLGPSDSRQIDRAVELCDAFVLIVSQKSLSSDRVAWEGTGAFERSVPLFPILVDITQQEFKERQPEWHALVGTHMYRSDGVDISIATLHIIDGLKSIGIMPFMEDKSSPVNPHLATGLTQFVGREKELERISGCLRQVNDGQGQVVGVVGEAGVGKSRLVLEFARSLPEEEYILLKSGCRYYGVDIAYLPITGILKQFFDIDETDDRTTIRKKMKGKMATFGGNLDDLLPPLYEVMNIKQEDADYQQLEPRRRRERIFEAIQHLLISESRIKPTIVILEDLQWIDKTSEEFLTYFIDSLTGARILLILIHRPEYISEWIDKTRYSRIRVDQLPQETSADLVASILTEGRVGTELRDFIVNRTLGNPLFIEELTHGLLEDGSIVKSEDRFELSLDTSDIEVPDTIKGTIAARLDHLEGNLRGLVQVASVIGREFAFSLLAAITSLQEELKANLNNLQGLEFIYEKNLLPELGYVFKHALTQEVAYSSLLLKKRKEIHQRIGQAIESIYTDRLEEYYEMLAYHFSRSDDIEKALDYLKLSGHKAVSNYSNWEAIRFYKDAIRVLDTQPETGERNWEKLELCLSTWRPAVLLNYPRGSITILGEAERLAGELGDEKSLIRVYRRFALYYSLRGDNLLGAEYSDKCFRLAEKIGSVDSMAEIANTICNVHFVLGHVSKVADNSRRGLQILKQHQREKDLYAAGFNVYSELSGWYGLSLGYLGELREARDVLDRGHENALEIDDRWGLGWIEYMRFALSYWLGDGDYTIEHAQRGIDYFADTGIDFLVGVVWSILGIGHFFLGRYEKANGYARKGVTIQRENGIAVMLPVVNSNLALIQFAQGDLEGALASAEESFGMSIEYETKLYEVSARMVLGRIMGEADPENNDAEQHIYKGLSMADEMKLKPSTAQGRLFLGELLANAGRVEEALNNLQKAEAIWREIGVEDYWLTRTQEDLNRLV